MPEEPRSKLQVKIPVKQYWSLLHTYLEPQWPFVALLTLLLFSHIGLRLVVPQILRAFIDTALAGGEPSQCRMLKMVPTLTATSMLEEPSSGSASTA